MDASRVSCASIVAIGNCVLGYLYIYKMSCRQWPDSLVVFL
jgi:hypothetical protein